MKRAATFFLLSSAAFAAQPEFQIAEGAWRIKATDFESNKTNWALERSYSSRSHHAGVFGLGWCSDFEDRLIVIEPNHVILKECENVTHFRSPFPTAVPPAVLVADGSPRSQLARNSDGSFRRSTSFSQKSYDPTGRLVQIRMPSAKNVTLKYTKSGQLQSLSVQGEQELQLRWEGGKISRIIGADGQQVAYIYEGLMLFRVIDTKGQIHQYRYDDDQNMSIVAKDGLLQWRIHYDRQMDSVDHVFNHLGCRVNPAKGTALLLAQSAQQRQCPPSPRGFAGTQEKNIEAGGVDE